MGNHRYIDVTFDRQLEALYPYGISFYHAIVPRQPAVSTLHFLSQHWFSCQTLIYLAPTPLLVVYLRMRKERDVILTTWYLILNQRFLKISHTSYDRIVRFTFIFFSMLVTFEFGGQLYEMLTSPDLGQQINSLNDLDRSNLTLMVGDKMKDVITKSDIPEMIRISTRTSTNLNLTDCTERLVNYGDVACAFDKTAALLEIHRLYHVAKRRRYLPHLMADKLGSFWTTYVAKKHLPYEKKFDSIMIRLLEAGIKVWATKNSEDFARKLVRKHEKTGKDTIKIQHLEVVFCLCFTGFVISFLVFLREIYSGKRSS